MADENEPTIETTTTVIMMTKQKEEERKDESVATEHQVHHESTVSQGQSVQLSEATPTQQAALQEASAPVPQQPAGSKPVVSTTSTTCCAAF